jgi:hypothetical protein
MGGWDLKVRQTVETKQYLVYFDQVMQLWGAGASQLRCGKL